MTGRPLSKYRVAGKLTDMPEPSRPRVAKLVIDQAIRENRRWEWVCLGMTVGFAAVGLGVLIVGAANGDGLIALSGAVTSGLFWPAFRAADDIRRANIAIRLMEIPLSRARTADQAAETIRQMYPKTFGRGQTDVPN